MSLKHTHQEEEEEDNASRLSPPSAGNNIPSPVNTTPRQPPLVANEGGAAADDARHAQRYNNIESPERNEDKNRPSSQKPSSPSGTTRTGSRRSNLALRSSLPDQAVRVSVRRRSFYESMTAKGLGGPAALSSPGLAEIARNNAPKSPRAAFSRKRGSDTGSIAKPAITAHRAHHQQQKQEHGSTPAAGDARGSGSGETGASVPVGVPRRCEYNQAMATKSMRNQLGNNNHDDSHARAGMRNSNPRCWSTTGSKSDRPATFGDDETAAAAMPAGAHLRREITDSLAAHAPGAVAVFPSHPVANSRVPNPEPVYLHVPRVLSNVDVDNTGTGPVEPEQLTVLTGHLVEEGEGRNHQRDVPSRVDAEQPGLQQRVDQLLTAAAGEAGQGGVLRDTSNPTAAAQQHEEESTKGTVPASSAPVGQVGMLLSRFCLAVAVVVLVVVVAVLVSVLVYREMGHTKPILAPPTSLPSTAGTFPPLSSAVAPSPQTDDSRCVAGRLYYTYQFGTSIGNLDPYGDWTNRHVSVPDCNLRALAFDWAGFAYGICRDPETFRLVTVNLNDGTTAKVDTFPFLRTEGLAYNPVDGLLYTTAEDQYGTFSLVRIEEDWTFSVVGSSLGGLLHGLAITEDGHSFGVNQGIIYSVDLEKGTSSPLSDGQQQEAFRFHSIAFDGSNLWVIDSAPGGTLYRVDVTGSNFTLSEIGDSHAAQAVGGAFCPF